jgi:hypothetical protein
MSNRTSPTEAGSLNRQTSEEIGREKNRGTSAEFGQSIGRSEKLEGGESSMHRRDENNDRGHEPTRSSGSDALGTTRGTASQEEFISSASSHRDEAADGETDRGEGRSRHDSSEGRH